MMMIYDKYIKWFSNAPLLRIILLIIYLFIKFLSIISFGYCDFKPWTMELSIKQGNKLFTESGCIDTLDGPHRNAFHKTGMKYSLEELDNSELFLLQRITPMGRLVTKKLFVESLHHMLPSIGAKCLPKIIWIVCLPRSGSTWMHSLCGYGENIRTLKCWELKYPTPNSIDCGPTAEERKQFVKGQLEQFYKLFPRFKKIHYVKYDEPDECVNGFLDCIFPEHFSWGAVPMDKTYQWYTENDMSEQYQNYKKLLQAVMYDEEKDLSTKYHCLVLKSPHHILKLREIAKVFPGSTIMWLHRDVEKVVASCCSMNRAIVESICPYYVDPHVIGRRTAMRLANAVTLGMQARRELENANANMQFIDVAYSELRTNPVDTLKRAFHLAGCTYSSKQTINSDNVSDNKNTLKHQYSLSQFGLDPEQLDTLFHEYKSQYRF